MQRRGEQIVGRSGSTIRPRYITATRWLTWRTTRRSWLMNSIVSPSSACRSHRRLTTCAWIETSSALTGSSQTRKSGRVGERPRQHGALALPAGQFAGIAAPDRPTGPPSAAARAPTWSRAARRRRVVNVQRLAHLLENRSGGGRARRADPDRSSARARVEARHSGVSIAGKLPTVEVRRRRIRILQTPSTSRPWWIFPTRIRRRGRASRPG